MVGKNIWWYCWLLFVVVLFQSILPYIAASSPILLRTHHMLVYFTPNSFSKDVTVCAHRAGRWVVFRLDAADDERHVRHKKSAHDTSEVCTPSTRKGTNNKRRKDYETDLQGLYRWSPDTHEWQQSEQDSTLPDKGPRHPTLTCHAVRAPACYLYASGFELMFTFVVVVFLFCFV